MESDLSRGVGLDPDLVLKTVRGILACHRARVRARQLRDRAAATLVTAELLGSHHERLRRRLTDAGGSLERRELRAEQQA
jgi:hypothetical protein